MTDSRKGTLYMFLSAVLFSIGGLCVKMIPWSAVAINGARSLISVVILLIYAKAARHRLRFNPVILAGAVCTFITNLFFSMATKMTTAANAIVLEFTMPVFIILFSWLFFRQRPKKLDTVTCLAVFAGIICFFIDGLSAGNIPGNIVGLISGMTYAGMFMLNGSTKGDAFSSVIIGQSISVLAGIPFYFKETDFSLVPLVYILLLGVLQTGIAYIFFCRGIGKTGPVAAALVSGIEPILNPVWVAVVSGEMISAVSVAGAVIVIAAVVAYNVIRAREPRKVPAENSGK